MSEESRIQDVRISGAGRIGGGTYTSVHVTGSGKLAGDIICKEDARISGTASAEGSLSAKLIKVSGTMSVKNDLSAGDASVSGSLSVGGEATLTGEMRAAGGLKIMGRLRADSVKISGSLHCEDDVECEKFESHGAFTVRGLLNADQIEAELDGNSSAGEIGGSSVHIYAKLQGFSLLRLLNLVGEARMKVNTIEANRVDIEATQAKIVRGHDVRIGIDCEIDRVEYTGTIDISTGATVREVVEVSA